MQYYNMPDPKKVTASERIVAALIDYAPMLVLTILVYVFLMLSMFPALTNNFDNAYFDDPSSILAQQFGLMKDFIFYGCIFMVIGYTYYLSKDLFGGRSLGKRQQKLQIVRKSQNISVSPIRLVLRNVTILLYFVEFIMYFVNPSERLGDKLCDTMVVHANEYNKQPVDKSQVALSISLVFLIMCVLVTLYYFFITFFSINIYY